jgi:hypothetical protein
MQPVLEADDAWDMKETQQWFCNTCWDKWQPQLWVSGATQEHGPGHGTEPESCQQDRIVCMQYPSQAEVCSPIRRLQSGCLKGRTSS